MLDKKIFFLLLFCIMLPMAASIPPTNVTVTLENPPAELYKDLNVSTTWGNGDANVLYWQLDVDGNTLVNSDNSPDNNLFSAYPWVQQSGTWVLDNGDVNGTAAGIIHLDYGGDYNFSDGGLRVSFELASSDSTGSVFFGDDVNMLISTFDGYELRYQESTTSLTFQEFTAGVNANLLNSPYTIDLNAGTQVAVTRNKTGTWTITINGATLDSGIDTNHTNAQYYGVRAVSNDFAVNNLVFQRPFLPLTSPQYLTHAFTTSGSKTIYATVQNPDGNTTASLDLTVAADVNGPVIEKFDYNATTGFGVAGELNYTLRCTDNLSPNIDYNLTNNGASQYSATDTNNETVYLNGKDLKNGKNTIKFTCTDAAGNSTSSTQSFTGFDALFYLVYADTGIGLTGASDYEAADVNTLKVYSYALDQYLDLKDTGDVNVNYSGIGDDGLQFVITYTDPEFPTVTVDFDLSVLDSNSIPVCFSKLFPFRQQIIYSSSVRNVIVKNALTGCYATAAKTEAAYQDAFQLSVYTVPMSYELYLRSNNSNTLLSLLDGGIALAHNLDLLIINSQAEPEVEVLNDILTANLYCQVSDCNIMAVQYISPQDNNTVTVKIIQNSTVLQTYTANSPDANSFSFTWNFTSVNFDKNNFITLEAEITRADGTVETITQLVTLGGIQGFIEPTLAIILAVGFFLFGITITASRYALGWFGLIIVIFALALLSMAPGVWYIPFMQAVMLIVGVTIFFIYKNETVQAI